MAMVDRTTCCANDPFALDRRTKIWKLGRAQACRRLNDPLEKDPREGIFMGPKVGRDEGEHTRGAPP